MGDISADQENVRSQRLDGLSSALDSLDKATLGAVRVSESCLGVEHTGRQNRALFIFAKMIAHNMSIAALVEKAVSAPAQTSLLDHFSVAALGRVSIDTAIMVLYLSEPSLTLDQWNLRRHVLFLHDATSRKRFLSALAKAEKAEGKEHLEGYAEAKETLTKSIDQYGANLGLSNESSKRSRMEGCSWTVFAVRFGKRG